MYTPQLLNLLSVSIAGIAFREKMGRCRVKIRRFCACALSKGYVRERDKLTMEDVQEKMTLHLRYRSIW